MTFQLNNQQTDLDIIDLRFNDISLEYIRDLLLKEFKTTIFYNISGSLSPRYY